MAAKDKPARGQLDGHGAAGCWHCLSQPKRDPEAESSFQILIATRCK